MMHVGLATAFCIVMNTTSIVAELRVTISSQVG